MAARKVGGTRDPLRERPKREPLDDAQAKASKGAASTAQLSTREREVAALVASGKSNRAIADVLCLSERTIEHHVASIFNKLNVHSRVELAAAVLRSPADRASENRLPLQPTSFVGRETEVAEITRLLGEHRLITLTGAGGVGKTRASLQVATNLLGTGDGVWFIELAPLTSGDYISSTVAQALDITLPSEGDREDALVRALKVMRALLVFDNCEHIVEPASRLIAAILRGCPNVRMLASSRQVLVIEGETTYRMPSLGVPVDGIGLALTAADSTRYAALTLFAARARAADRRFTLSDENVSIVADICRRLDGIPLAIELAASRVKMFSLQQVRDRLDERFRILAGGSRDVLPRHQTLRALIDWSHDLLDGRERALFRRSGIFATGFAFEGAFAVGSGEGLAEADVIDVLASLVDKSLVLVDFGGEAVRYRLLESTRMYAREKLAEAGEREPTATRHLRYLQREYSAPNAENGPGWGPSEVASATLHLDDVRAALDIANERSDVREAAELLCAFGSRWAAIGLDREGIARIEPVRDRLPDDDSSLRARLAGVLGYLYFQLGYLEHAFALRAEAVAHARTLGSSCWLADAVATYAYAYSCLLTGRLQEAEKLLAEGLATQGLPPRVRRDLMRGRARLDRLLGNFDAAKGAYEFFIEEDRSLGDSYGERFCAYHLAEVEHARGETIRAIEIVDEMIDWLRVQKSKRLFEITLVNYSGYLVAADRIRESCVAAREAIDELAKHEPGSAWVAQAMEHLALALALAGDEIRAARLEGYAVPTLQRHGWHHEMTETTTRNRLTALLRDKLTQDHLARLMGEGATLAHEAAIELALEQP